MSRTPNWGLTAFGGPLGGTIADDSGRFSAVDPFTIDRLIEALTHHDHSGSGQQVPDPSAAPTLEIDSTQGTLAGNTRFYYRIAYRDVWGLETAASPELAIDTPGFINSPGAPTLAVQAGGAIPAGTWRYAFTALVGTTQTTLGTVAAQVISTTGGLNSVLVTLPAAPAGAETMRLWRIGPSDLGWTSLGDFDGESPTYLDTYTTPSDPCACDPATQPPTSNSTAVTNSVVVTVPVDDQPLLEDLESSNIGSWVIYRTIISGVYPTASTVAEVVTPATAPATGLVVSFTDTGLALDVGSPQEINDTFPVSPKIPFAVVATVGDLPDPTITAEGTVMIVRANRLLYSLISGQWAPSGGLFGIGATLPDPSTLPDGVPFVLTDTEPFTLHISYGGDWKAVGGAGGGGSSILTSASHRQFMPGVADDGSWLPSPYFAHEVVLDAQPQTEGNGDIYVSWAVPVNSDGDTYDPDFYRVVLYQAGAGVGDSGNQTGRNFTFHGMDPTDETYTIKVFCIIGTSYSAGAETTVLPAPPPLDLAGSADGAGGASGSLSGGTTGGGGGTAITDTFGRDGELNGSTTETGGKVWTSNPGSWVTDAANHRVEFISGADNYATIDTGSADGVLKARLINDGMGVALRSAAHFSNGLILVINSGIPTLFEFAGGSYSLITTFAGWTTGDLLEVDLTGSNITVKNATAGTTLGSISYVSYQTNTIFGMFGNVPASFGSEFSFTPA